MHVLTILNLGRCTCAHVCLWTRRIWLLKNFAHKIILNWNCVDATENQTLLKKLVVSIGKTVSKSDLKLAKLFYLLLWVNVVPILTTFSILPRILIYGRCGLKIIEHGIHWIEQDFLKNREKCFWTENKKLCKSRIKIPADEFPPADFGIGVAKISWQRRVKAISLFAVEYWEDCEKQIWISIYIFSYDPISGTFGSCVTDKKKIYPWYIFKLIA